MVPVLTDWVDSGHMPLHPREYFTEVVVGVLLAGCVWLLYREADQIRALAETDLLTGLFNRRRFQDDLVSQVAFGQRFRTPLSLVYVDVDRFKDINDRFGHAEGDRILAEIGGLLERASTRQVDRCYRLGGDEFAVLLVGSPARAGLDALLRTQTQGAASLERHGVTLSLGVVELVEGEDPDAFAARADHAMYAAKNGDPREPNGGACFAKWRPTGAGAACGRHAT